MEPSLPGDFRQMQTYAHYGSGAQNSNSGDGSQYNNNGSGQQFIGINHIDMPSSRLGDPDLGVTRN